MAPHDDDRWPRVEALFERALDLARRDRDAFLARETPDDPTIAAEVRALLAADTEAGAYFDRVARAVAPTDRLTEGGRAGPYRITGRLGVGGMGTVYRAVRADGAFDREVALKVLRGAGGDVRRFLAERQTLARLDHVSIARLYDGGVTDDGLPYFAMELVEGQPITAYAEARGLDVDDRLRLFQQVCEAVQFAHGRLVVHRDLKPSNVLVTEDKGLARVKLLDFGIAKVLDDPDLTIGGSVPRTPAYAAPEQVRGEEVTTATDVYALGVLLYELLTGRRPYRVADDARAAFERAILETEPTRPSTAVGVPIEADPPTLTLPDPPERLAKRLAGDLDQIILKALRKEPAARYPSAEALARDIGRHLDGQPVEARPETVGYRVGKFVRRHRAWVAAASVGVVALMAGLGVALWQARVAAVERDRAEHAAAFMIDLLGEFDPTRASGGRADPEAVLDQAVERIEAGVGDPAVQARLFDHIGQIYQTYAQFDQAEWLLGQALAIRVALHGESHSDVVESLNHIAWLCFVRGDYGEADSLYARALQIEERVAGRTTNAAAASIEGRGLLLRAQGDPEAAIPLVREALAIREAAPDANASEVASTRNALASLYTVTGRQAEAVPLLERVVAERRAALGRHVHTAQALSDYGAALVAQNRYAEAVAVHREALSIRRERLGDSHPHVAQSLSHIGWALQMQGRPADAEPLYREALAIRREHFGEDHTSVGNSLLLLGEVMVLRGDAQRGLGIMGEAVQSLARVLGERHSTTLSAELRLAAHLSALGRAEVARPIVARLLPQLRDAFGPDHDKTRQAEDLLARLGEAPVS